MTQERDPIRRRVLTTEVARAWSGAAPKTQGLGDAQNLAQHQLTVLCDALPSAGTLQVRGRPRGASGFVKINDDLDAIDLTVAGSATQLFQGFFDALSLEFTDALVDATSVDVMNSTVGQELFAFGGTPDADTVRRRIPQVNICDAQTWDMTGVSSKVVQEHRGLTQHQLAIVPDATPSAGILRLRGRPPSGTGFVRISDSLEALDLGAAVGGVNVLFTGLYEAYSLEFTTPIVGATGITATLYSVGEDLFDGTPQSSGGVFPNSAGPTLHQWLKSYNAATGNFTLTQPDYSDLTGTPTIPVDISGLTFLVKTGSVLLGDEYVVGDSTSVVANWGAGTVVFERAALTGDATAAANSNALTLATVNANVGTFGSVTQTVTVTVNAKGLVTAISNNTISASGSGWTFETKSADFNAAKDYCYYVDTASVVATLPGSPAAGDRIRFIVKTNIGGFQCGRNGNKIMGYSNDLDISTYPTMPFAFELVYTGAADGWVLIST